MENKFIFSVWEGETKVGYLCRYEPCRYEFRYDTDYIEKGGHELCVTMPLSAKTYEHNTLHPFFANFVSEGWLEEIQKIYTGGRVSPLTHSADVIAQYGRNCIGAFSIIPGQHFSPHPEDVFSEFERAALEQNALMPGVHPKVLAIEGQDAVFQIADGGRDGTHIAKLQRPERIFRNILHNEYLATRVVAALLPEDRVCDVKLGRLKDYESEALFIRRFDRDERGGKIPFYEFNQLLGKAPEEKYDGSYRQMADFIAEHASSAKQNGIKTDLGDLRVLFRRIAVDMLIGNTDAHLKNFALMKAGNVYRLTPNYDLLSSAMYADFKQVALEVGGKKLYNIGQLDAKRVIGLADEFRLSREELQEDVAMIEKNLPKAFEVIDAYKNVSPETADHFRKFMQARWNGAFKTIKTALKNPPKNILQQTRGRILRPKP